MKQFPCFCPSGSAQGLRLSNDQCLGPNRSHLKEGYLTGELCKKQSGKYNSQEERFSDELIGKSSTPLIKCLHLWGDVRCSDEMFFE